ncbi:MAG: hypothetical protein ACP5LQ_05880 [Candidatus Methanodesulfokora sp.]
MPKSVFLRGIDEDLYAQVKARAALLGITVSEAVNRALEEWLRRTVHQEAPSSPEGKKGYLVVVNDGKIKRIFETLNEAVSWLQELHSKGLLFRSMIKPLREEHPRFLEVGGGFDELL